MIRVQQDDIQIRDFTLRDIEKKVEWINNPLNNQYLHYDIPLEIEKTKCWFMNRDISKRIDAIIEYKTIPVGVIGLLQIDDIHRKAEFYITIGENSCKRKGIATVATKLLLDYAFQTLNLRKIYLNVDEMNVGACCLYEKVGFKCEGIFFEDMFFKGEWINRKRYAIIKDEQGKKGN